MILQYWHKGGTNPEVFPRGKSQPPPQLSNSILFEADGSLPENRETWGHLGNEAMRELYTSMSYSKLRFYCRTSGHNRVAHFETTSSAALSYFQTGRGGIYNKFEGLYTLYSDHTAAYIPQNAPNRFDDQGDIAMTNFPFWLSGTGHWGIRGIGGRWECDDFPGHDELHTLHQIFVNAPSDRCVSASGVDSTKMVASMSQGDGGATTSKLVATSLPGAWTNTTQHNTTSPATATTTVSPTAIATNKLSSPKPAPLPPTKKPKKKPKRKPVVAKKKRALPVPPPRNQTCTLSSECTQVKGSVCRDSNLCKCPRSSMQVKTCAMVGGEEMKGRRMRNFSYCGFSTEFTGKVPVERLSCCGDKDCLKVEGFGRCNTTSHQCIIPSALLPNTKTGRRRRRLMQTPPGDDGAPAPPADAAFDAGGRLFVLMSVAEVNTTLAANPPPTPLMVITPEIMQQIGKQIQGLVVGLETTLGIIQTPTSMQPLWNTLFWVAIIFAAVLVLHLTLRGLFVWRKIPIPGVLAWPRLELACLQAVLPMIVAAGAKLYNGDTAAQFAAAVIFAIILPACLLAVAVFLILKHLALCPPEARKAHYVAPKAVEKQYLKRQSLRESRRHRNTPPVGVVEGGEQQPEELVGEGNNTDGEVMTTTAAAAAAEQPPSALLSDSDSDSDYDSEEDDKKSRGGSSTDTQTTKTTGGASSSNLEVALLGSSSHHHHHEDSQHLPRNQDGSVSVGEEGTEDIGDPSDKKKRKKKKRTGWEKFKKYFIKYFIKYFMKPVFGYDPALMGTWVDTTEQSFVSSYGVLFDSAQGPPVVYDSVDYLWDEATGTYTRHSVRELPPQTRMEQLRVIAALMCTVVTTFKICLFINLMAASEEDGKTSQTMVQVVILMTVTVLYWLYMRFMVPINFIDLFAEVISTACDMGTFVSGLIILLTPADDYHTLEQLGWALLVFQLVGMMVNIMVPVFKMMHYLLNSIFALLKNKKKVKFVAVVREAICNSPDILAPKYADKWLVKVHKRGLHGRKLAPSERNDASVLPFTLSLKSLSRMSKSMGRSRLGKSLSGRLLSIRRDVEEYAYDVEDEEVGAGGTQEGNVEIENRNDLTTTTTRRNDDADEKEQQQD